MGGQTVVSFWMIFNGLVALTIIYLIYRYLIKPLIK
jgi:hypothetical protein